MKKFNFNYLKRRQYHIYEFRSDTKILSNWHGYTSNKWDTEYCEVLDKNKEFWLMPFTGAELVLFPSIVFKFQSNSEAYVTIMYDDGSFAVDGFSSNDCFHSNWFIKANILDVKIHKEKNTLYFKVKNYSDIMKLQDCSDESLELFYLYPKKGYEKKLEKLICSNISPELNDLKECVDMMVITSNCFDYCDDSITIISFDKIHKEIQNLEILVNKVILKYEESVLDANDIDSFIKSVRYLRILNEE